MEFTIPKTWINKPLNICVVGAGGTGSALITELFQTSFLLTQLSEGKIYFNVTVYDDDTVSFTNIGRQSFWSSDLNLNKAQTLVDRFNIYGGLQWQSVPKRFTPNILNETKYDLLITCTDSAQTRSDIGKFYEKINDPILWIDTGNDEISGQVIAGFLGKTEFILPNVYQLYPELSHIKDDPTASCSHIDAIKKQGYGINKSIAIQAVSLLWELVRFGKINRHGSFINIKEGTTTPLPIDPLHWSLLGFKAA